MRLRLFAIVFVALLLLSACSAPMSEVFSEINNASELSLAGHRFSGLRQTSIRVEDGSSVMLNASLSVTDGACAVYIENGAGEHIYSGENISSNTSFHLQLDGPEVYYITADSARLSGSYSFTWDFVGRAGTITVPEEIIEPTPDDAPAALPETNSNLLTPDVLWNGEYHCAEPEATAALKLTSEQFFEFVLTTSGGSFSAVAQIDAENPMHALYSRSDGLQFEFYRSGGLLEITQTGDCTTLPEALSGDYLAELP